MSTITAWLFIISAIGALIYIARRWWRLRRSTESLGFAGLLLAWAFNSLLAAAVILLGLFPGVNIARFVGALAAAIVIVGLNVSASVYNHRHNGGRRDATEEQ